MKTMSEAEWQKHLRTMRNIHRTFSGSLLAMATFVVGVILFSPNGIFPLWEKPEVEAVSAPVLIVTTQGYYLEGTSTPTGKRNQVKLEFDSRERTFTASKVRGGKYILVADDGYGQALWRDLRQEGGMPILTEVRGFIPALARND